MTDYVKFWVNDAASVQRMLANETIVIRGNFNYNSGEVYHYPLHGVYEVWKLNFKSSSFCEITGSLHNYWNKGTNWNDFSIDNLFTSIIRLCNAIQVSPDLLTIRNLEFGVNIQPLVNTSVILDNVICYKNHEPKKEIKRNIHFLECAMDNYFVKIYDKGLQARKKWNLDVGNILRFEVKAMNNRYLKDANISTLTDLLNIDNLQVLAMKIHKVFKDVVFDDPTIDLNKLSKPERKNYESMILPKKWTQNRGNKNSTIKAQETRFKTIVNKHGSLQLSETLSELISGKSSELLAINPLLAKEIKQYLNHVKSCGFSYLEYNVNINKVGEVRRCLSCGNDIGLQVKSSKFCSAKFFGDDHAHKCRNANSNSRNNFKRQLDKIKSRGQFLFDIAPFIKIA